MPVAVKASGPDRWPHWNTHTITPNVADSDRMFITIALTGSTTEPKARKSRTNVATAVSSPIHGSVPPRLDSSSTSIAVSPPTRTAACGGGASARIAVTIWRACGESGCGRKPTSSRTAVPCSPVTWAPVTPGTESILLM